MMFGEPREDLWINYFAVSADLERAEGMPIAAARSGGQLRQHFAAGHLSPVPSDGRYLIDGGVLNNLPVDIMAGLRPGRILAVDVSQGSVAVEFKTRHRWPSRAGGSYGLSSIRSAAPRPIPASRTSCCEPAKWPAWRCRE